MRERLRYRPPLRRGEGHASHSSRSSTTSFMTVFTIHGHFTTTRFCWSEALCKANVLQDRVAF